ncbi:hypothetical protein PIB30_104722, partial [Stylosanthes scabra]|nr:hypothetical protein [Stylosanthes scabra]
RPFLKTARFELQYDDDTFSLSIGKITEIFHVTHPPAPRKKGAHQLRVGTKKIEPEKLLRSEKRKEAENPKNDALVEKELRITPPQLKKKRKKVPLNLERKKEKKKKKQEEGKSEKKPLSGAHATNSTCSQGDHATHWCMRNPCDACAAKCAAQAPFQRHQLLRAQHAS